MSGDQDLWREVLWLAIQDALNGVSTTATSCKEGRLNTIRHARIYLTRPNRDFNDVCHLAGVDPQATRERLTKLIADAPSPEELIDGSALPVLKFSALGRTESFA